MERRPPVAAAGPPHGIRCARDGENYTKSRTQVATTGRRWEERCRSPRSGRPKHLVRDSSEPRLAHDRAGSWWPGSAAGTTQAGSRTGLAAAWPAAAPPDVALASTGCRLLGCPTVAPTSRKKLTPARSQFVSSAFFVGDRSPLPVRPQHWQRSRSRRVARSQAPPRCAGPGSKVPAPLGSTDAYSRCRKRHPRADPPWTERRASRR